MEYQDFLKKKEVVNQSVGFEPIALNPMLYDFQSAIISWAIRKGKAAIFADCGLGKTPMQLEWARNVHLKTDKPVLILAPLAVSAQTKREGKKFYNPINICESDCR